MSSSARAAEEEACTVQDITLQPVWFEDGARLCPLSLQEIPF